MQKNMLIKHWSYCPVYTVQLYRHAGVLHVMLPCFKSHLNSALFECCSSSLLVFLSTAHVVTK
jgi:hypothetical protein